MGRCSVCGRNISDKNAHFGLGCLKNMCDVIGIEKVKNLKGETLLNNKIAKLNGKKKLNKNEKIMLTNRYLTLKFLSNIPIKAYNREINEIKQSIKKIGIEKLNFDNSVITLKQAYEIFKLYNKFQKIKNREKEVDSEFIQNFLFDNLLFAFSTYYRNKKYFGGVIASIQYDFWKTVVEFEKFSYPLGTEFIEYSLQDNPEDRFFYKGKIIDEIEKDENFKNKINEILEKNNNKRRFNITDGLNYVSSDLFLALNNTTINVIGNKEENIWKLDITITDRYDFTDFKEINEYLDKSLIRGVLGSTANNLAMISVASGVMHEYNVTINFSINKGCDKNE